MHRIAVALSAIFAGCFLMVFAGSCGDREQTLGPNEHQQQQSLASPVVGGEDLVLREENTIFIAFPETRLVKKISDPWISDAVLSMLPDAARGYFVAKGVVYIEDAKTAAAIAIIAGMEDSDASGVVWIGRVDSWSCVKCCFMDPPCNCCPKDDDKDQYIKAVAEAQ